MNKKIILGLILIGILVIAGCGRITHELTNEEEEAGQTASVTTQIGEASSLAGSQINISATQISQNGSCVLSVIECEPVGEVKYNWELLTPGAGSIAPSSSAKVIVYTAPNYDAEVQIKLTLQDDVVTFTKVVTINVLNGPDITPPAPPAWTGIAIAYHPDDAYVSLYFKANPESDVAEYLIYRSEVSGSGYQYIGHAYPADTTYTDPALPRGKIYYYVLKAKDNAGNVSEYSTEYPVTITSQGDTTPPAAPAIVAAGVTPETGHEQILLLWAANAEADLAGYILYRSTTSGSGYVQVVETDKATLSHNDTGLTPETTYYYVLKAKDASGNVSAYSNEFTATTLAAPVVLPVDKPIVFTDMNNIYFMSADGTQVQQLTTGSGYKNAIWSPDKTKLYGIKENSSPYVDIYKINADGSNEQFLTNYQAFTFMSDISPDGSKIFFESDKDNGSLISIPYTMNTDGSNVTPWTAAGVSGYIHECKWSPDGSKVIFSESTTGYDFFGNLWVADADGSNAVKIASGMYRIVDVSPDGSKLLVTKLVDKATSKYQVQTMNIDGSNVVDRTGQGPLFAHCFSADGTKFLYLVGDFADARLIIGDSSGYGGSELYDGFAIPDWK